LPTACSIGCIASEVYSGIGEGEDDLQVFDAENFAKVLTGAS